MLFKLALNKETLSVINMFPQSLIEYPFEYLARLRSYRVSASAPLLFSPFPPSFFSRPLFSAPPSVCVAKENMKNYVMPVRLLWLVLSMPMPSMSML